MNVRTALGMTATVLTLSALAACGTHSANGTGSPSHPQSSAPTSSSPSSSSSSSGSHKPLVLKVNAAGGDYHMVVGQTLIVQVTTGTKIEPLNKGCDNGSGAVLKQLCTAGSNYEYQAVRAGTAQLMYTIRPDCKPGAACPAWIRNATFKVTVS